ncbi:ABC transporter permease [Alcaligenaceae bacterium SJ-26]|nr:ABC transporter permease [Alcaligenaceae bacterium SJ-26]
MPSIEHPSAGASAPPARPDLSSNRPLRPPVPWLHRIIVLMLLAILMLPVLGTLLYSLSTSWSATILPSGLTFKWYIALWSDSRFLAAFGRSLLVCLGALAVSLCLILPLMQAIHSRFPRLDRWMNILILLPFAIPPVVSSVGLMQLFSGGPLPLAGTPWILIGCFFTIALPFIYRTLSNSLQAIQLQDLLDAAHLLGASTWRAAWLVVLPNLRTGLMISVFLSFSFLFGEFVFANLLAGSRYETLQVYLYNMRNDSGHFTSALVISYFAFVVLVTWAARRLNKDTV